MLSTIDKINKAKYDVAQLNTMLEKLTDGTHHTPTYTDSGIRFISVTNITENNIDFSNTKFITKSEHKELCKRCNPKPGDILLTKIGSIGRAAVVPDDCPDFSLFVSVALLKLKKTINAKYLCAYLNTPLCNAQFQRHLKGIGVPDLHLENIEQTSIVLPPLSVQIQLAQEYEKAYSIYKKKLDGAKQLVDQLNSFVLSSLGLSFEFSTTKTIYAIKHIDIDERIDADFYSPQFMHFRDQIEHSPYDVLSVGEISNYMVSGFAAGKQDQADDLSDEERVPHLRPFSITPEGELSFETQKFVPRIRLNNEDYCQKNEILFNNTNSPDLVGKTTVFDSHIRCAASNHITRIVVKEEVNPYYVAAVFNVLLSIGYWKLLCTNFNNQAGVNTETLKKVRIPVPPKSLQDEIAAELMSRRAKANELRKEAHREWRLAKEQFEKKLLGE